MDWEDYNNKQIKDEGGGRHAENPLAALLAWVPDFNSKELEAFLCDLPIPDAANQAPGMTMAEAVQVSYLGVTCMKATLLTPVYRRV